MAPLAGKVLLPALAALLASLLVLLVPRAEARSKSPSTSSDSGLCRLQEAQEFLKRPYLLRGGYLDAKRNDRSIRFRVQHYGRLEGIEGFGGYDSLSRTSVLSQIVPTRFFGLPIQVHKAIAPALRCVERRIQKTCNAKEKRYVPHALGGYRQHNTFRGAELSNHLFGIAIDIDPDKNPCCGCVDPWPAHPACQGNAESVFERTALPRCWIRAFERYGFYWLGRDPKLRDTMHFEFLGDPGRVLTP